MKNGRKFPIKWEKSKNTIGYSLLDYAIKGLYDFAIWALIIMASMSGLADISPQIALTREGSRTVLLVLLALVFFSDILVKLLLWVSKGAFKGFVRVFMGFAAFSLAIFLEYKVFIDRIEVIISGLFGVSQKFLDAFNVKYNHTYFVEGGVDSCISLFVLAALITLLILMWSATIWFDTRFHWLFLPVGVAVGELIVGIIPEWRGASFTVFAVFLMLLSRDYSDRLGVYQPRKIAGRKLYNKAGILQTIAITVIILAVVGLVSAYGVKASDAISERNASIRIYTKEAKERVIASYKYKKALSNRSKETTINNMPPEFYGEEICILTTSNRSRSNIYARSFIGMEYEDHAWTYDENAFEATCIKAGFEPDAVKTLVENNVYNKLNGVNWSRAGYAMTNPKKSVELDIQSLTADNLNLYVPYFTDISLAQSDFYLDVLPQRQIDSGRVKVKMLDDTFVTNGEASFIVNCSLAPDEEDEFSWYDEYVRRNYTKGASSVPTAKEAAEWLMEPCRGDDMRVINRWRLEMAELVANTVAYYDYSWSLDELSGSKDPVEYFLAKGHKGYCMHFASAGALILQNMGIPARYVQGYVVNGANFIFRGTNQYQCKVVDRDSHAWVEIYLDHVGWVPVEMTPSYSLNTDGEITGQEEKILREKPRLVQGANANKPWQVVKETTYKDYTIGKNDQTGEHEEGLDFGKTPGRNDDSDVEDQDDDESSDDSKEDEAKDDDSKEDDKFQDDQEDAIDNQAAQDNQADEQEDDIDEDDSADSSDDLEPKVDDATSDSEEAYADETLATGDKDDNAVTFSNSDNKKGNAGKVILPVLGAILLVASALGIVYGIFASQLKKFFKAFEEAINNNKYSRAVRKLNRYIFKSLRIKGRILSAHPTDNEYERILRETYPHIDSNDWDQYMVIVKEASFANHEISKLQAKFCYDLYKKLKKK